MMAGGVLAGARIPCQAMASKPGEPLSEIVGTAGATGERSLLVTPSQDSLWVVLVDLPYLRYVRYPAHLGPASSTLRPSG